MRDLFRLRRMGIIGGNAGEGDVPDRYAAHIADTEHEIPPFAVFSRIEYVGIFDVTVIGGGIERADTVEAERLDIAFFVVCVRRGIGQRHIEEAAARNFRHRRRVERDHVRRVRVQTLFELQAVRPVLSDRAADLIGAVLLFFRIIGIDAEGSRNGVRRRYRNVVYRDRRRVVFAAEGKRVFLAVVGHRDRRAPVGNVVRNVQPFVGVPPRLSLLGIGAHEIAAVVRDGDVLLRLIRPVIVRNMIRLAVFEVAAVSERAAAAAHQSLARIHRHEAVCNFSRARHRIRLRAVDLIRLGEILRRFVPDGHFPEIIFVLSVVARDGKLDFRRSLFVGNGEFERIGALGQTVGKGVGKREEMRLAAVYRNGIESRVRTRIDGFARRVFEIDAQIVILPASAHRLIAPQRVEIQFVARLHLRGILHFIGHQAIAHHAVEVVHELSFLLDHYVEILRHPADDRLIVHPPFMESFVHRLEKGIGIVVAVLVIAVADLAQKGQPRVEIEIVYRHALIVLL